MTIRTKEEIEAAAEAALIAHGAAPWIAAHVAHATAEAEARGNVICGLSYLESYCIQLASGRVNGTVEPAVSTPRAGAVLVDAGHGFAQPAFARGLALALEAAEKNGIALLSVAHSHTCTSLGYFTRQIAAQGLIGIGFTNASPVVAPPGGHAAVIGTNPIAMTVPGAGAPRMHFDFSTSAVALGKITMAKYAGEPIPEGWAVDSAGKPTTDPDAALSGALVSAGGYKGWGFGLMAEVMAACLTGSVNSLDVGGLKLAEGPPHGLGQSYVIIDPAVNGAAFADRFERLAQAVAAQEGARIPGASETVLERIEVLDALWSTVTALGATAER